VAEQKENNKNISGKTYSLYGHQGDTEQYYRRIRELTDLFLQKCPDQKRLLYHLQRASKNSSLAEKLSARYVDHSLISSIRKTLKDSLSVYTKAVDGHLKSLTFSQRFDRTLRTKEQQYHLYMVEIELLNRIYREAFKGSQYKFALIAHCLRDFRPRCRSVPGDFEEICEGCTEDCFINLGSLLLKRYSIHPYISVTMELERLFMKIKAEHPNSGALGIACVPELVHGMRLCIKLDIPAVGVPLDANRCARWMKECRASSFNPKELEELIR
jgi:hypothetical protein